MRRVVGVVIAVAALVGAAASQPRVLESARLEAREAAEKAATSADARVAEQEVSAAVRTTQVIIWAAGGLIALLALIFGLRRQSGGFAPVVAGATSQDRPPDLATPAGGSAMGNGPRGADTAVDEPEAENGEPESSSGLTRLSPAASAVDPSFSQQPFGRYLLLDRLGEGGLADVYTAVIFGAEGFRRRFVIKRLRPELLKEPSVVSQLINQANVASSLVHSNIVPVLDFGKVGGEYFLATEYVLGRDLDRLTARHREANGTGLPLPAVLYAAHETLKALEYAHTKTGSRGRPLGIVHRDMAPRNVLVSTRGEIKLVEFGIVQTGGRVTRAQADVVKGNVLFMSPEQARGKDVDARSDLFSLGLVMYHCLTGEALYRDSSGSDPLLRAASGPNAEDLTRLRALPEPAGTLIERALQIEVGARYQSAAEFLTAVAPHLGRGAIVLGEMMNRLFGEELRREEARFTVASASASQPVAPADPRPHFRPPS